MYNEVIYLCDYQEGSEKDEYGDPVLEEKRTDIIFAKVKSIGQNEFYQAQTVGLKPELKFVLPDYFDYSGQAFLIHEGMRYKILKTYRTDKNELEITCYGGVRDVIATIGY